MRLYRIESVGQRRYRGGCIACIGLLVVAGCLSPGARVPRELQRAWEYRCSPKTAHIEWVIRCSGLGCDLDERYLSTRISGARWAVVSYGNSAGLQRFAAHTARPVYAPEMYLVDEAADERWVPNVYNGDAACFHGAADGVWRGMAGLPYDVRLLGFAASFAKGQTGRSQLVPEGTVRYGVRSEANGLRAVTAHDREGGEVTWWLDPHQAWQPIRTVRLGAGGSVIAETTTKYACVDGYWSPVSMRMCLPKARPTPKAEEGVETEVLVEVVYASYDRASHPNLGPTQIGILPGMWVHNWHCSPIAPGTRGKTRVWDDESQISREEWVGKLRTGLADESELKRCLGWLYTEDHAEYRGGPPTRGPLFWLSPERDAPRNPKLWEAVVRAFVIEHRLGGAEATTVWSVCEDCEAEAFAYLDQHKAEIEQIRKKLRGASRDQADRLNQDLNRLQAPLESIFQQKLKPALERLRPSTEPSTAPARP